MLAFSSVIGQADILNANYLLNTLAITVKKVSGVLILSTVELGYDSSVKATTLDMIFEEELDSSLNFGDSLTYHKPSINLKGYTFRHPSCTTCIN